MARCAVCLVTGPLGSADPWHPPGAGAVLVFEGVVRPTEGERELAALVYEAYEPLTTRELSRLATEIAELHDLVGLTLEHSVGRVPAAAISFRLRVAAAHRKPALAALDQLIDRMKAGVPLWKVPEWATASGGGA